MTRKNIEKSHNFANTHYRTHLTFTKKAPASLDQNLKVSGAFSRFLRFSYFAPDNIKILFTASAHDCLNASL